MKQKTESKHKILYSKDSKSKGNFCYKEVTRWIDTDFLFQMLWFCLLGQHELSSSKSLCKLISFNQLPNKRSLADIVFTAFIVSDGFIRMGLPFITVELSKGKIVYKKKHIWISLRKKIHLISIKMDMSSSLLH